jgi:hypothetical protein
MSLNRLVVIFILNRHKNVCFLCVPQQGCWKLLILANKYLDHNPRKTPFKMHIIFIDHERATNQIRPWVLVSKLVNKMVQQIILVLSSATKKQVLNFQFCNSPFIVDFILISVIFKIFPKCSFFQIIIQFLSLILLTTAVHSPPIFYNSSFASSM